MAPTDPDRLARIRAELAARNFPRWYWGWGHFAWSNAVALSAIGLAVSQLDRVSAVEALVVPASLLVANVAEHRLHQGPMHHRVAPLALLYERHTLSHHRFYTHESMQAPDTRSFYLVLFPPWAPLALFVLVAPIAAGFGLVGGPDAAWLFVATGMAYFALYEWLHLAYHLDPDGVVGRLPGMATLRRHHTLHHDPMRMGKVNFNVTFPFADWLFGTWDRGR